MLLFKIYVTSERAATLALEKESLRAREASCERDRQLTSLSYPAGCLLSSDTLLPPEAVSRQGPQLPLRQLPDLFQGHTSHPPLLSGFF